jgi:hypothetical protein
METRSFNMKKISQLVFILVQTVKGEVGC